MRGLAILLVAIVLLSAVVRGQPHFTLRPSRPMPAVNVPWLQFWISPTRAARLQPAWTSWPTVGGEVPPQAKAVRHLCAIDAVCQTRWWGSWPPMSLIGTKLPNRDIRATVAIGVNRTWRGQPDPAGMTPGW